MTAHSGRDPGVAGADRPIIAIVGPTAAGKTAVAVELAGRIAGEIISADSAAVYRGLDIGTAKPTESERQLARFHVLDVAEPCEVFSAARFKACAEDALVDIRSRGLWPILCGGTGFYVRALLDDLGLTDTPRDDAIRLRLTAEADALGVTALYERLATLDAVAAARIHAHDRVRIVRAMEIIEQTGRAVSALHAEDVCRRSPRPALRFGLSIARDVLHRRIEARVDAMVEAGLEGEVAGLLARGMPSDAPGLQVLGYKEMVAYLTGAWSLEDAVSMIKRNTRRFARRQMTWFRADRELRWLDVTCMSPASVADDIVGAISTPATLLN